MTDQQWLEELTDEPDYCDQCFAEAPNDRTSPAHHPLCPRHPDNAFEALNKCEECCPVLTCPECGPCQVHDLAA